MFGEYTLVLYICSVNNINNNMETKTNITKISPVDVVVSVPGGAANVPSIYGDNFNADMFVALFCHENDIKKSSLEVYARNLGLWFDWVNSTGRNVKYLTMADVVAWRDELLDNGKSSLTVAGYLTAVRKFYAWLDSHKRGLDITRGVRTPKRVQQFRKQHLQAEKATALLNHYNPAMEHPTEACKASKRNFAIVNLMLRTGLRCVEVVRANVADIAFKDGHRVLWVHGKGRDTKDRFVMLTDKAFAPIQDYLSERGNILSNEPLFASESNRNGGKRLTTRAISWICKQGLKSTDVGLDGREYTAHSLRHTTAVMILSHGGKIEDCQEVLRHANVATTQIYLESIKEQRRVKRFAEKRVDTAF